MLLGERKRWWWWRWWGGGLSWVKFRLAQVLFFFFNDVRSNVVWEMSAAVENPLVFSNSTSITSSSAVLFK